MESAPESNRTNDFDQLDNQDLAQRALERYKDLVNNAKRYRKFGNIALLLSQIEETAEQQDAHETEKTLEDVQAEGFIGQLEEALSMVDYSLARQLEYKVVNHKQINTKEALEEELQSGTAIPELDIRFDKEGKPWISHSPRSGSRFLTSKPIHECTSEEVAAQGQRLSLEDGLDLIQQYAKGNPNYRVVLELKELGSSEKTHEPYLESIKNLLENTGLEKSAIFATLSPEILQSTQDVFPDNSKILNGGIAPIVSYDIAEKTAKPDSEGKEFAIKFPGMELFFSNATRITKHQDGHGKQTGYIWFRLPFDTARALAKMNKEPGKVGGASLTIVNKVANMIEPFNPKMADSMRKHYLAELKKLGITPQLAISKRKPVKSIEGIKKAAEEVGVRDIVFYSDVSPGDFALSLPPEKQGVPIGNKEADLE